MVKIILEHVINDVRRSTTADICVSRLALKLNDRAVGRNLSFASSRRAEMRWDKLELVERSGRLMAPMHW